MVTDEASSTQQPRKRETRAASLLSVFPNLRISGGYDSLITVWEYVRPLGQSNYVIRTSKHHEL